MTYFQYPQLIQRVILSVGLCDNQNNTLNLLKEVYRNVINSPRRCENIITVGQLLKVLEIRDVLSENNIEPLKDIAQIINDKGEILRHIVAYENACSKREYNFYASEPVSPQNVSKAEQKNEAFENAPNGNPYIHVNNQKKQRIFETVIEQIGTFWRDLARNLKIRECIIDEIDKESDSLYSKASKLLEIYEKRADTQKWLIVLCDALERARRRDLARSIQDIVMMNI
ncbi:uncharacterized protein LOC113511724 [Galleria mellonella]|uniref:Uncharacterized protein LOC113511724 n=1 Tax=Galleria mellonella TaxID=7137 RepID=A0A6J1WK93_GALME|nr:uncharacterized protein LOC113511724 [Galleria mellonella]